LRISANNACIEPPQREYLMKFRYDKRAETMLRDLVSQLLAESRLKCRVAKSGASWLGSQRREVLGRLIYLFKNSPPQDIGRDTGSARTSIKFARSYATILRRLYLWLLARSATVLKF